MIDIFLLFIGAMIGVAIANACIRGRCSDCAYRAALRSDIYKQMDEETT